MVQRNPGTESNSARAVAAICLLILLVAGPPVLSSEAPVADAAVMVGKLRLGSNLEGMAIRVAMATQTYRGLATRLPDSQAQQLIASSVRKVLPGFQDAWDANLARAYAETLSKVEIASLAEKGQSSPFFAKFSSSAGIVGSKMQVLSSGLLQQVVTAALADAVRQAGR